VAGWIILEDLVAQEGAAQDATGAADERPACGAPAGDAADQRAAPGADGAPGDGAL